MTRHPVPTVFSCVASRNKRGRSATERWQPHPQQLAAGASVGQTSITKLRSYAGGWLRPARPQRVAGARPYP